MPASTHPDPETEPDRYGDTTAKRAVAWIFDFFLVLVIFAATSPFTFFAAILFPFLVWPAIDFAYRFVTLSRASATLGMRVVGIEIRDARNEKIGPLKAALHTIAYLFSMALVFPRICSITLMLITPKRQGLMDHALGTVVVNREG